MALDQVVMNMDFEDDDWGDSSDSDDGWGDGGDDWKRRKREVNNKEESRLMEEEKEKDMVERKKREVADNLETPLVPEEENRRVKRDAATKWKKGVQVWHNERFEKVENSILNFFSQPGEDVVAKVEMFRRGANYTAMWLPKMEWIVSITYALDC